MSEWKTVLCPVDFSDTSRRGMLEALEVARRLGARVLLLHVFEQSWLPDRPGLLAPPDLLKRQGETARADLAAWVKEAGEAAPGRVSGEMVGGGHPAVEIARVAEEGAFDLVIMGTHGRRGLRRLVIGSVAEEVVRTAPCSVLVVRPKADAPWPAPD